MSYVVAGVSGNTGRVVAETLLARKQPVRVIVRDATKGEVWKQRGAEVAVADLADHAALGNALQGARGAWLLVPPSPAEPDFPAYQDRVTASLVKASSTAAVPHVVLLSSVGAQHERGTGPIAGLHRAERAFAELRTTRLTALRAAYFMENLGSSLGGLPAGVLPSFVPADLRLEMIATHDIGTTAADLLLQPPPASQVIDLAGPAHSMAEAAEILSRLVGKPITVAEAPLDAVVPTLTGFGMSTSVASGYREMLEAFGAGRLAFEGGDRRVAGATSLETVLRGLLK
jgi:uncharacterized protein YbjT (DUF2867 family)